MGYATSPGYDPRQAHLTMRTFVAIDITEEIRRRLSGFMEKSRSFFPNARWVHPEGMHVTLKFLGEISVDQKQQIEAALHEIKAQTFEIKISELGFFPNPRSPRVFWAGIEAGNALPELASAIDEALIPLGFQKEKQSYKPHLTLARFKPGKRESAPAASAAALLEHPQPDFGTMTANEFFLYQSKLSPRGSTYTKLIRFGLEDHKSNG